MRALRRDTHRLHNRARPDTPFAWLARNRPPRDEDANAATFAINAVFPRAAWPVASASSDVVRIVSERIDGARVLDI